MSRYYIGGNSANTIVQTAKNAAKQPIIDNLKDTGVVILIVIVLLAIVLILVYIIRMFRINALKKVEIVDKIVALDNRSALPFIIPAGRMAVTTRGQEFTFSFWIYLSDVQQASSSNKLLFVRDISTNVGSSVSAMASPIIMIGGKSNTMYFAYSTSATSSGRPYSLNDITDPSKKTNHVVAKVDYVPLQRWIHYAAVTRDNSVTIFMDGDVYSIVTTNDIKVAPNQPRPVMRGTSGDGVIGNPTNTINGFMGKFEFYNYALSQRQIQNMYKAGPIEQGILYYLGIGNYGIRSPIYNKEQVQ